MACPCCVCIRTQEVGVVEDLGQFKRLLDPGFHCIPFPLSQVAGTLSLRIQQLDVTCETKTRDNVFVRVEVAVQFRVITVSSVEHWLFGSWFEKSIESLKKLESWFWLRSIGFEDTSKRKPWINQPHCFVTCQYHLKLGHFWFICLLTFIPNHRSFNPYYRANHQESAYDAYYRLSDPRGQIQAYVFDVIRSTVPRMELDEAFASKKEIAAATLDQLETVMKDYGYEIMNTLVTDLSPDARVKASMNEINASKRLKEAASHKAEADKVQQVKAAEADAEARYLSGLGVARQRKAIVSGLQASISEFSNEVDGVSSKDVMDILLLTQYFDTLRDVGANNIILEHEPGSVAMLQQQVNRTLAKNKKQGFLS